MRKAKELIDRRINQSVSVYLVCTRACIKWREWMVIVRLMKRDAEQLIAILGNPSYDVNEIKLILNDLRNYL